MSFPVGQSFTHIVKTNHVEAVCTVWLCSESVTLRLTLCLRLLYLRFSRQEYWSGLLCLPPGDLLHPRIKPISLMSPALAGIIFTTSATKSRLVTYSEWILKESWINGFSNKWIIIIFYTLKKRETSAQRRGFFPTEETMFFDVFVPNTICHK